MIKIKKAGLYIHIPFCNNKCPYCDFYSVKYEKEPAESYVKRLTKEFEKYKGAEFDTVYFGGGTPSILEPQLIGNILDSAQKAFNIASNSEITIECNPSKNLEYDFKKYADYGINRISLGMQSAVKSERLALGRRAGREEVAKAIFDAKNAGIANISLDLMLGTPKQTFEGLNETFAFIKEMDVSHISAYMLKIEESTPFYTLQSRLNLPDEDYVSDMYLKTVDTLSTMGFHQYEVSNFAKPNFESRHNMKYWKLIPYLGIGKSAHSLWNGKRFYYDKDFNIIDDGTGGSEEEQIMLGLRLTEGIKKSLIKRDLTPYINAGYMKESDENISFTPKGFLVSSTIISELI
ncbi:MAG: radical SAM family heme chaperone HemW [Eubacterium sp.]|nr:radical SAM family heme chaperone HemW [Eubacterium sp.]